MTQETETVQNSSPEALTMAPYNDDLLAGSVGRVDWGPLAKLTGIRPFVSRYGVARYSPWEWKLENDSLLGQIPSAAALEQESKSIINLISTACDKEQSENTLRLRQRAVDIFAKHVIVCQFCEEVKYEIEQLAQNKLRIRRALEYLGVVEGINDECREIRKIRLTEDLVRDEVEEELFQEKGLCQEIRQLYMSTLNEFEIQYRAVKACYQEVHSLWSDQKETLEYEAESIGLKNSSPQISFCQGTARLEGNVSNLKLWEKFMKETFETFRRTIESSKALRQKIHSPILTDSVKDLKLQNEKIIKAFKKRIEEVSAAKKMLELHLCKVLKEISLTEDLYADLERLGRQVDFNLKVVQTRLDIRSRRPGVERCRDIPEIGLVGEVKVINERFTSLQAQMKKITDDLNILYASRKKLERQIHVKKHSLALDQERCMVYRSKFPNPAYLLGY